MPDLLTSVVFLPTIGALLLTLLPAEHHTNLKAGAIAVSLGTMVASFFLWASFDGSAAGYQFATNVAWIPSFGIRYHVGIDGISVFLIVLTTVLTPLTLVGAWSAVDKRVREFVIAILLLETGMLGAFVAMDLFLFYVFWEAMLIPMYFLIGIWGGQRRLYAAIKFFIFTMAGSLLMLVAIIYVAWQPDGSWDFALATATTRKYGIGVERWLFAAFALAFLIKVPVFPFHTWLPDAHTEAPTAGSVILAGVLLKLGIYGLVRFAFPMFPTAAFEFAPVIGLLSVAGIIYGALAAWVQPDMKKLVAYSSVSHLGFCVLGLCALTVEGVTGSIYQCLAHGISTGALFMLVGVLYERRHTRMLADYGGIARKVPVFAFFLVFVTLASAGMPALSGFPGEFLILLGTYTSGAPLDRISALSIGGLHSQHVIAILAATGVILAAVYLLFMVQKVLFGPLQHRANETLKDMNAREVIVLGIMAVIMVVMGVKPGIFLDGIEPAADRFVKQVYSRVDAKYLPDGGKRRLGWSASNQLARPPPVAQPALQLKAAPQFNLPPGVPLPRHKDRVGSNDLDTTRPALRRLPRRIDKEQ